MAAQQTAMVIQFLYLEGNSSITSSATEVGDLPTSLVELEKKNAEKEAKQRVAGL